MKYHEFINQVREQMELGSQEEAQRLTSATLETLGERIYRSARTDLAAQLPKELNNFLRARVVPETTMRQVDRFPLSEFYHRISARSELSYPQAKSGAQVVMAVLKEAVSAGEWQDLEAELPAEFNEILDGS